MNELRRERPGTLARMDSIKLRVLSRVPGRLMAFRIRLLACWRGISRYRHTRGSLAKTSSTAESTVVG
jgi:hypothetical protein